MKMKIRSDVSVNIDGKVTEIAVDIDTLSMADDILEPDFIKAINSLRDVVKKRHLKDALALPDVQKIILAMLTVKLKEVG